MKNIVALIPAAGYSSRMGLFKPLLPVGSSLVIEKAVRTFQEAGIADIYVVVGYKADLLIPVLKRLDVQIVMNPDFQRGMYTSVQAGVGSLGKQTDAFFLLPVDYAFVSPETIGKLLTAYHAGIYEVVYPVNQGKRGHPPLISADLRDEILMREPEGGLKTLLNKKMDKSCNVCVDDEGVLLDMDLEEDYQRSIKDILPPYPNKNECLKILQQQHLPGPVLEHVHIVADLSCRIAEHLNSKGYKLHLGCVMAAAYLHDIAKGCKNHAQEGCNLIYGLGYPEVASIISSHMQLDLKHSGQINETTVVYLADKMVSGNRVVPLEERLHEQLKKHQDESARQAIRVRMEQAEALQKKIENILQLELDGKYLHLPAAF